MARKLFIALLYSIQHVLREDFSMDAIIMRIQRESPWYFC